LTALNIQPAIVANVAATVGANAAIGSVQSVGATTGTSKSAAATGGDTTSGAAAAINTASTGSSNSSALPDSNLVAGAAQSNSNAPLGSSVPNQGGSSVDGANSAASAASQAARVRFVDRVAKAFQSNASSDGSIRMRLSPPELGSLKMEIRIDQGQMTAKVEAETPEARSMLLDNLPALRDRLDQQDVKITRFDVTLTGQSSSGQTNTPNRDAWGGGGSSGGNSPTTNAAGTSSASVGPITFGPLNTGNGQLNVII